MEIILYICSINVKRGTLIQAAAHKDLASKDNK